MTAAEWFAGCIVAFLAAYVLHWFFGEEDTDWSPTA